MALAEATWVALAEVTWAAWAALALEVFAETTSVAFGVAHVGHDHFGGRRHFARGGLYDYGLGCPYYQTYTWPYTCTY